MMERRRLLRAAGGAGLVTMAGCLGIGSSDEDDGITIGLAIGLTGPVSETAQRQEEGATLAVEEINDNGGILGRDVELIVRDTELDPGLAAQRSQALIENDDIDVLMGAMSGATYFAMMEIASNYDVPYFPGASSPREAGQYYDKSFVADPSAVQYARACAEYTYNNLAESVHYLTADYEWGNTITEYSSEWYVDEMGGEVTGITRHPLGETDYASYVREAEESDAEAIIFASWGADPANAIGQAREFGLDEDMEFFTLHLPQAALLQGDRDVWEDVYFTTIWDQNLDYDLNREFNEKCQERFGHPGTSYMTLQYTNVYEYKRGVELADNLNPDDMVEALEDNPEFNYFGEDQYWRECDHQAVRNVFIARGKPAEEWENDYDPFEILEREGGERLLRECGYLEE